MYFNMKYKVFYMNDILHCEECFEIMPPIINRRGRNLCLNCIFKEVDRELDILHSKVGVG